MARTKRSAKLDTRNARLKANVMAGKMHQEPLAPGQYLAYRRPEKGGAGSWFARWHREGKILQTRLGTADDFQEADEKSVLSYAQAQSRAHTWFKTQEHQAIQGDESLPEDGPLTVARALDRYFARNESQGGKSVKDMRQRAELWIKPTLGPIEIGKLTRGNVEGWHQSIAESERQKRPKQEAENPKRPRKAKEDSTKKAPEEKSPPNEDDKRRRKATANRVLAILKAALTCARVQGWVICSGDAWELVKPFRAVEEPRQNYLTPEEQQRLLNAIQDADFRILVAGALATGCRYGELCRMKVEDFDPSGAGSVLVRIAKSGKPRRVLLTQEGRAFFQCLTAGHAPGELIFQHQAFDGRDWKGERVQREWKRSEQQRPMREACIAACLPVMGFHQLRHSYASALVAAGMPLALVAKLTGHADTRMLERHYAHLAPSDLSRALEAMAPSLNLPIGKTAALAIKVGTGQAKDPKPLKIAKGGK